MEVYKEYKVPVLKEMLRKLNLPTSGTKLELLTRLSTVNANLVNEVTPDEQIDAGANPNAVVVESMPIAQSDVQPNNNDRASDSESDGDEVAQLRKLVKQLTAEVRVLRDAAAVTVTVPGIGTSPTSTGPSWTIGQPFASSSVLSHQNDAGTDKVMLSSTAQPLAPTSALPGQYNIVYTTQSQMTPTRQMLAPLGALPTQGNAVYTSQPIMMSTAQPTAMMSTFAGPSSSMYATQPIVMTAAQQSAPLWTMSPQQMGVSSMPSFAGRGNGLRTTTTCGNENRNFYANGPNHYASTLTPSAKHPHSLKDVTAIIPVFDPADDTYTSSQFVERVEQLKEAYAWDDAVLVFAVLSKLKGVAKRWADAQPVFADWPSFVVAFLTDFPHVSDLASAHIALMNTKMGRGDKFIEFYYKMLALGRRENIDDMSIIRYIINGLHDENVKRSLSAMQFGRCADLLKSMQNLTAVCYGQNTMQKRSPEIPKEQQPRNEKENNVPNKKVYDSQSVKHNNNGIVCFKCRQRGHIARNCTQVRRIRVDDERVTNVVAETNTGTTDMNVVNCKIPKELTKTIKLGTKPVIVCAALIDSGSGKSLIKRSVATKIRADTVDCCEKLIGFAGGELICKEGVRTKIEIDEVVRQAELLVVEDKLMTHDVLVGLDILGQATVIIENGTCKMMAIKDNKVDIGTGLDGGVMTRFSELVGRYGGCFGEELHELGKSRRFRMTMSLTSAKPVCKKPYNVPIPKRKIVEGIVTELLHLGIIRPSKSLYASPIVLVRKQNGEDRMCIDYRQLNAITEKQPWCMPTVDEVLCRLSGHTYFTTLDLMSGYYQIELDEGCKHLTAFVTHQGHYEFNRMPFGLRNAPCTFQRMMSKLIEPMGNKIVSYVDEIIIATHTADENLNMLEEFLNIVENEGLTLRTTKCSFLKSTVTFLGHIVDAAGIRPGANKTDDVRKFPVPKNQHDVRRFLGLTGFFRKFVAYYAQTAKPLTSLTRKDAPFIWSDECEAAFRTLIDALTSAPVLAIFDVSKAHQLHTDASSIGIAAILTQEGDSGKWHAVAYFSRCCNEAERNYHAYELEVLAIVEACERFRMYVLGKHFTVVSDCQSISTAKLTKPMVPRVARWLLKLQEYEYQVIHRPGESMRHVDAMSRAPRPTESADENANKVATIVTHDWVSMMQQADEKLKEITVILAGKRPTEQRKQLEAQYVVKNHRLFYKLENSSLVLVVPKGMRWRIVKLYHDDIGHPALETVLKRMMTTFWFPRMRNYVKSYIRSCIECAYHKEPQRKPCQLYGMEVPTVPFQTLHLDHLGPFIKSKRGNEYALVCVDALTRYVVIYPTKTTQTKPVLDALNQLTLYFGLPKTMVTDRGTAFTSSMFANYCENSNIQHIKVAVRTPRSNGLAERVNQNVLSYLKTSTTDPKAWDDHLRMLQWTQNTKVNATTKFAPLDLIFDFPLRDISGNRLIAALHDDVDMQMNSRREEAAKNIEGAREKWKTRFDSKHAKPFAYNEGDLVLIESPMPSTGESRKLQPKYKGPYVVTKVLRYDRYVVEDLDGNQRKQRKYSSVSASDKMKPWCALFPELDDQVESDAG